MRYKDERGVEQDFKNGEVCGGSIFLFLGERGECEEKDVK